jgi:hypothetical protein
MDAGALISVQEYLSTVYEPDRDYVDGELQERNMGERTHARLQAKITSYLMVHYESLGFEVYNYELG